MKQKFWVVIRRSDHKLLGCSTKKHLAKEEAHAFYRPGVYNNGKFDWIKFKIKQIWIKL